MKDALAPLLPHERKAVQTFLNELRTRYPQRILQAILFGSKARGDGHPTSDIDILLIVPQEAENWRFRHAISDVAADVSLKYDVLIGPRLIGRQRWEQMAQARFNLYENIRREGIPLTEQLPRPEKTAPRPAGDAFTTDTRRLP